MTDFKFTQKTSQNSELEEMHTSGSSKLGQAKSSTIIHHFTVTGEDPLNQSCEIWFSEDTDVIFQEMWFIYKKQQIWSFHKHLRMSIHVWLCVEHGDSIRNRIRSASKLYNLVKVRDMDTIDSNSGESLPCTPVAVHCNSLLVHSS